MSVFADSSALVKLYSDEADHELVRALTAVAVAQIARVEVPAALWRKYRMGELAAREARVLVTDFEADFFGTHDEDPRFSVVAASTPVYDEAARLCAVHGLRAYDGVQLATALATRVADAACTTMAVFDNGLADAASAEGFAVIGS